MPVLAASPKTQKNFRNPAQEEAPMLPKNIVIGAIKYADKVEGTDAIIPFDKAFDNLYQRMGWK